MRKTTVGITLALLFLAAAWLTLPLPVNAAPRTIVVPDDYPTIQAAIDNAAEGDTVFVKKGVYVENPVVNKPISLVGEDRDKTVIDVTAGLKVASDNVLVTGFTVYDGWEGISVSANNCRISKNKITDSESGIVLHSSQNTSVTENLLHSIRLSAAIKLIYSNNNLVKNNYVDSCTEGIQLREGSSSNVVTENVVTNCEDVAVRLLGSGVGKTWFDPSSNTIMRNNISNSGVGTTVYGSNRNTISNNNYVNNSVQFSADEWYLIAWGGKVSVNTIERNYWSDYNGTDANGDGVGDTPYIIDENNKDSYPLMMALKTSYVLPEFPKPDSPNTTFPAVSMVSPENKVYSSSSIPLTFSINKPASKIEYSLDGQSNVTISGNTTLTGLPNGYHNVTIYATDEAGNIGTSETLFFTVNTPKPFPVVSVVAATTVITIAALAGLLLFRSKRHQSWGKAQR